MTRSVSKRKPEEWDRPGTGELRWWQRKWEKGKSDIRLYRSFHTTCIHFIEITVKRNVTCATFFKPTSSRHEWSFAWNSAQRITDNMFPSTIHKIRVVNKRTTHFCDLLRSEQKEGLLFSQVCRSLLAGSVWSEANPQCGFSQITWQCN